MPVYQVNGRPGSGVSQCYSVSAVPSTRMG